MKLLLELLKDVPVLSYVSVALFMFIGASQVANPTFMGGLATFTLALLFLAQEVRHVTAHKLIEAQREMVKILDSEGKRHRENDFKRILED